MNPLYTETGWAPGPVWTGAENLASTGIRSPDRQDLSESVYRLLKHKKKRSRFWLDGIKQRRVSVVFG